MRSAAPSMPSSTTSRSNSNNEPHLTGIGEAASWRPFLLAVPRGLRHRSPINRLPKSGTLNPSTGSLGFCRECPTEMSGFRGKADMTICGAHVCFCGRYWGRSRHRFLRRICPLMTQSGHLGGPQKFVSKSRIPRFFDRGIVATSRM
jgi:hypothetical protein